MAETLYSRNVSSHGILQNFSPEAFYRNWSEVCGVGPVRNVPHRLMYLDTFSSVSGAVRGSHGTCRS